MQLKKRKNGSQRKTRKPKLSPIRRVFNHADGGESQKAHLALLDELQELVCDFDLDGKLKYANPAWLQALHYNKEEMPGLSFESLLEGDQLKKWRKIRQRLLGGLLHASQELILKTKSGESVIARGGFYRLNDGQKDHDAKRIRGIFQDVTAMRQLEKDRDNLFVLSVDMLCVFGYSGYFKRVNPAFHATLGFTDEDFVRKSFLKFVHPEDAIDTLAEFSKIKNGSPSVFFENRWRCKDGSYRWLSWTAYPVPQERLIYAVARDVTAQRRRQETLERMAFTDPLTGLFNRRGFAIVGERMLKIARRRKFGLLLMMADLDGMKSINDQYGHKQGDAALITAARLFRERFRDSDLIARIGGDEFVALFLTNPNAGSDGKRIRESLDAIFTEYNRKNNPPQPLSVSLGFAYAPSDMKIPLEELMDEADRLMYERKRETRELQHSAQ